MAEPIHELGIIGGGRVAAALAASLGADLELSLHARRPERLKLSPQGPTVSSDPDLAGVAARGLIVIAVSDDSIQGVAGALARELAAAPRAEGSVTCVLHTSGATTGARYLAPLLEDPGVEVGSIHPLVAVPPAAAPGFFTHAPFVIETSGVADPADIVRNLMDPVILREASLETVLCVMDATAPPAALDDALQRSQLRVADIVALSKLDLADAGAGARMRAAIRALRVPAVVVDAQHGEIPAELLFPANVDRAPKPREPGPRRPAEERFETLSWTSDKPVSLPRLQQAINRLAPKLARAKGLFETVEQPGRMMVFQFAAGRATLAPGDAPAPGAPRTRIVFIAELGVLSKAELDGVMEACVAAD